MSISTKRWVEIEGSITSPREFKAAAVTAGIKAGSGKLDLALLVSGSPARCAAVFTKNRVVAAPVVLSRKVLRQQKSRIQGVLVNSGNANACTGPQGLKDAVTMATKASELLTSRPGSIAVASTGVIGQSMPMTRIHKALPELVLGLSSEGGRAFSDAILTTDTSRKTCVVRSRWKDHVVTIAGTAKGAGMIHPRMATLLAFVTTDAQLSLPLLREALREAADASFNRVTVDGDTSTNDSLFLMANGASLAPEILLRNYLFNHFKEGLKYVCTSLARQVARDGEGARKFITVTVQGGRSHGEAESVARAIANSPLVKTALAGADANWGRVLCAAGYSGAAIDPERIDISLNGLKVCRHGQATDFDETRAKRLLEKPDIRIELDLHRGKASETIWTCDLTEDYIKINASYRS